MFRYVLYIWSLAPPPIRILRYAPAYYTINFRVKTVLCYQNKPTSQTLAWPNTNSLFETRGKRKLTVLFFFNFFNKNLTLPVVYWALSQVLCREAFYCCEIYSVTVFKMDLLDRNAHASSFTRNLYSSETNILPFYVKCLKKIIYTFAMQTLRIIIHLFI